MKIAKKMLAILIIVAFTITVAYLPSPVKAFGVCADRQKSCEAACPSGAGRLDCFRDCAAEYDRCCAGKCGGAEDPEAPPEN